ncbi:MAG: hypothetical protein AAGA83_16725 [Cyanobacteria bacterium P01_F01_bin.116]
MFRSLEQYSRFSPWYSDSCKLLSPKSKPDFFWEESVGTVAAELFSKQHAIAIKNAPAKPGRV